MDYESQEAYDQIRGATIDVRDAELKANHFNNSVILSHAIGLMYAQRERILLLEGALEKALVDADKLSRLQNPDTTGQ